MLTFFFWRKTSEVYLGFAPDNWSKFISDTNKFVPMQPAFLAGVRRSVFMFKNTTSYHSFISKPFSNTCPLSLKIDFEFGRSRSYAFGNSQLTFVRSEYDRPDFESRGRCS